MPGYVPGFFYARGVDTMNTPCIIVFIEQHNTGAHTMAITYAQIAQREARLNKDFGENMARRYFTEEQLESLGRLTRGPNKGRLRGFIRWEKVESGGWVKTARYDWDAMQGNGYVEKRVGKVIWVGLYMEPKHGEPELVAEFELPRR